MQLLALMVAQSGGLIWHTCSGKTGGGDTWGGNLGNEWHYQCETYSIKDEMKLYLDGTEKVVAQGDNVGDPCAEGNRPIFIAHREDGQ